MTNAPLVSVVASVHNGARFLRESIESILSQEGVEFELIVIDDGSTDGSSRILHELAARDRRIRLFEQENRGLTASLIRGCREARGDFIARHDSDDRSVPGRLAKQAACLEADARLSMVACWSRALGPEDEVLFEVRCPFGRAEAMSQLVTRRIGPPGHGSVMFRKSAYRSVGEYRKEFYFAQDTDLWLRLAGVGELEYLPEFLYEFRVSGMGVSAEFRAIQYQLDGIARRCREARSRGLSESDLLAEAARIRPIVGSGPRNGTAGLYFIASCLLKRGDPRAMGYFRAVVRENPWDIRAWAGVARSGLLHPRR